MPPKHVIEKDLNNMIRAYCINKALPNMEKLKELIEDPQLTDEDRLIIFRPIENQRTVWHSAARKGHTDFMIALLTSLKDPKSRAELALMTGKVSFYSYFMGRRTETALHVAVRYHHEYGDDSIKKIIEHVDPATKVQMLSTQDDHGMTPVDRANGSLKTWLEKIRRQEHFKKG